MRVELTQVIDRPVAEVFRFIVRLTEVWGRGSIAHRAT
jgi:hypothetical protein